MTTCSHQKPKQAKELQVLNYLHARMNLSPPYKRNRENLYRGYAGEMKFNNILEKDLSDDFLVLYDLLLESNSTDFQIDCLTLSQNIIYLFEVKNFEGDFIIQDESWYVVSTKKEIRNPLLQLERSNFLLRNLLQELGFNFKIKSYLVFVNKEFALYQLPLNLPIILPTQLPRLMRKLNSASSPITNQHIELSKQLTTRHKDDSTYHRLPDYKFNQMRKGIPCISCRGFLSWYNNRKLICEICGQMESIESAVIRNVVEFTVLFPDEKITLSRIHEWCGMILSKNNIRRILIRNLELSYQGRFSHYNFPVRRR